MQGTIKTKAIKINKDIKNYIIKRTGKDKRWKRKLKKHLIF